MIAISMITTPMLATARLPCMHAVLDPATSAQPGPEVTVK